MLKIHTEVAHHPIELREELVELARVAFFIAAQRLVLVLLAPVSIRLLLLFPISLPDILSNLYLRCKQRKNRQLVHCLVSNVALRVED